MKRNYAIDYIKFFAIFAVILIHTQPFEEARVLGVDGHYIDFAIDTLARFAVPFFFVSSGYLFGKKISINNNESVYFSGYIYKLMKIFICWFLFYLIYDLLIKTKFQSFNIYSFDEVMNYFKGNINLEVFFYGASSGYQLWYLVALIWSVFILFIFINLKKLNILLLVSFILNIIGLFSQSYSGIFNLPVSTRDGVFFGLFYTTLGCFFAYNKTEIMKKINKQKASRFLAAFIIFSVLQIVERLVTVFILDGKIGDYFIFTVPTTISLFLYVMSKPELGKKSILTNIGKNSIGIYVIHVFFIKFINLMIDVLGVSSINETIIWNIILSPAILIISYISYQFLQKVKDRFFLFIVYLYNKYKEPNLVDWKE
ncbi:acyltransferase [Bacillus sp. BHET2]|uniref:acyltransferase n=1 Tax=Bacillus sp. BHET2 TaxID=2583818 RepID=UPI00110F5ABB|nr:acyltransferase [Bacillus sp. BHET2]TMU84082.1 acyltransferase [Bacillus sp. BHET2]